MSYELLEDLLPYLKTFEQEHGVAEGGLAEFAHWLAAHASSRQVQLSPQEAATLNGKISQYLGLLYKHAKGYIKKAFEGSGFSSVDDFAYLATLWQEGSMRKTELIHFNISEVSSGMEVIKRLLRHGYIRDYPDPEDRRSRRVELTPAGQAELLQVMERMRLVSEIVTGNLSQDERITLHRLLEKLSVLHLHLFMEKREEGLEEIREGIGRMRE